MSVVLVGDATSGLKTIELKEGDTIIGRGEISGVTDKKCSRSQATATLAGSKGPVRVSIRGANSSAYRAKGSTEIQFKPKGSSFYMNDDDTLFLLGKMYPFVLRVTAENSDTDMDDDFLIKASEEFMDAEEKKEEEKRIEGGVSMAEGSKSDPVHFHPSHEMEEEKNDDDMDDKTKIEIKSENYRLGLASLGTGVLRFDPKRAAVIACEEIKNFLDENRDSRISIVLAEPNKEVFEEFQACRPADERFVLTSFSLAALPGEGLPCKYVACETNWRWKPADPEMNRVLASKSFFFENHRKAHSDVGKVAQVYETAADESVFLVCVVPNGGNPLKPDYIEDRAQAESALRSTYRALLSKFNDHVKIK